MSNGALPASAVVPPGPAPAAAPEDAHGGHGAERGFAKLDFELNDYPGALKTSLFGIQHVLVMFTAMVGGPLIVGRLLNLPEETRIAMVCGTMIGCGLATMVSALGINIQVTFAIAFFVGSELAGQLGGIRPLRDRCAPEAPASALLGG